MKTFKQLREKMTSMDDIERDGQHGDGAKNFKGKHLIKKKKDVAGNKDDVYKGSTKKRSGKRIADPGEGEDSDVYEDGRGMRVEETGNTTSNTLKKLGRRKAGSYGKPGSKDMKRSASKAARAQGKKDAEKDVSEELSDAEKRKKEEIVKSMKKKKDDLMKRYGDDWEAVMHATATKLAAQSEAYELKEMVDQLDEAELFSTAQLNSVRKKYAGIKKMDPEGSAYRKLTKLMDGMKKNRPERLKQLADANINFVSALARNRVGGKGDPNPSKTGYVPKNRKKVSEEVDLDESHLAMRDNYVNKINELSTEIQTIARRLITTHKKAQAEKKKFAIKRKMGNEPSTYPDMRGELYDAKYLARSLEDVRDQMKALEIDEMSEDCIVFTGADIISEALFMGPDKKKVGDDTVKMVHKTSGKEIVVVRNRINDYKARGWKVGSDKSRHEETELTEMFKSGRTKLNDGKSINITDKDAKILNKFHEQLNNQNKKEMEKTIFKSKDDFDEILDFAKNAV